jgi:tripartite-type tricarboxylate transporter receptor subunit TctC
MALLPELPALNEEIPGYEVSTWYGMFAPVQMQKRHVDKLNQALVKIVSTADMRQRLAALGAEPVTLSPEQFALTVRKEIAKWAKVIKDSGARPD